MPRGKGTAKTGGRKAGTPNKVSKASRELVNDIIERNATNFDKAMEEIYANDKVTFAAIYVKLIPYVTPKLNSVDIKDTTNREKDIEDILKEMSQKQD